MIFFRQSYNKSKVLNNKIRGNLDFNGYNGYNPIIHHELHEKVCTLIPMYINVDEEAIKDWCPTLYRYLDKIDISKFPIANNELEFLRSLKKKFQVNLIKAFFHIPSNNKQIIEDMTISKVLNYKLTLTNDTITLYESDNIPTISELKKIVESLYYSTFFALPSKERHEFSRV